MSEASTGGPRTADPAGPLFAHLDQVFARRDPVIRRLEQLTDSVLWWSALPPHVRRTSAPAEESSDGWFEVLAVPWQSAGPGWPVHQLLHRLQQTVQADVRPLELVLGVGCLGWRPADHEPVQRHLLTCPARIVLAPDTGELSVQISGPVQVELDMLDPALRPDAQAAQALVAGLQEQPWRLLERADVGAVLQELVALVSPEASYLDDLAEPEPEQSQPWVRFAPALVLRARSWQPIRSALQRVAAAVTDDQLPAGLRALLAGAAPGMAAPAVADGAVVGVGEQLVLPQALNPRQIQAIQCVRRPAGVVRTPPGTGADRTAAMLVQHLLAQGRRVLLTAATDRPLATVLQALPEQVRCLVTDLPAALDLATEPEQTSTDSLDRQDELQAQLVQLLERQEQLTERLVQQRQADVVEVEHDGQRATPTAAAMAVRERDAGLSWLVDYERPQPGEVLAVGLAEVLRWWELLIDDSLPFDALEAAGLLLELDQLPEPAAFAELLERDQQISTALARREGATEHPAFAPLTALQTQELADFRERFGQAVAQLDQPMGQDSWATQVLAQIRAGQGAVWAGHYEVLHAAMQRVVDSLQQLPPDAAVYVPGHLQAGAVDAMARQLQEHLRSGGALKLNPDGTVKLTAFTPRVVKHSRAVLEETRVDGTAPATVEQLTLLLQHVAVQRDLDALDRAWPAEVRTRIEAGGTPHERYHRSAEELQRLYALVQVAHGLQRESDWLRSVHCPAPEWASDPALRAYLAAAEAAADPILASATGAQTAAQLASLRALLEDTCRCADVTAVTHQLRLAVRAADAPAYATAYARLVRLHAVRRSLTELDGLTERLRQHLPGLVAAVLQDPHAAEWPARLPRLTQAWGWAADWGRCVTGAPAEPAADLQQHAELAEACRDVAAQVVLERIRQHQQHGRLRVAPVHEVLAEWGAGEDPGTPWQPPYDVAVVVAADRIGPEGVLLYAAADGVVLLGDDLLDPLIEAPRTDPAPAPDSTQQDAWPQRPNGWRRVEDSLLHLADALVGTDVTLVEHDACRPEIVELIDQLAGDATGVHLLPVRASIARWLPPVQVHEASDEASAVTALVDQVLDCVADARYEGRSIGVLALGGPVQRQRVHEQVALRLPADRWTRHQVCVIGVEEVPGCERDVLFVVLAAPGSAVAATEEEELAERRRYAAICARAREQLWLFHAADPLDPPPTPGARGALLTAAREVAAAAMAPSEAGPATGVTLPEGARGEALQLVREQLVARGYGVQTGVRVLGQDLDLVVAGPRAQVGLICLADSWPGPQQYRFDLAALGELARCGWVIAQLRAADLFLQPETVLAQVVRLLTRCGIEPGRPAPASTASPGAGGPRDIPAPGGEGGVPSAAGDPSTGVLSARMTS